MASLSKALAIGFWAPRDSQCRTAISHDCRHRAGGPTLGETYPRGDARAEGLPVGASLARALPTPCSDPLRSILQQPLETAAHRLGACPIKIPRLHARSKISYRRFLLLIGEGPLPIGSNGVPCPFRLPITLAFSVHTTSVLYVLLYVRGEKMTIVSSYPVPMLRASAA